MQIKNPISIQELETLLANDATAAQTLENYFEFHEDRPFSGEYRLKEGIVVFDENATRGLEGFGKGIRKRAVKKANKDARSKRDKKYNKVKNDPNRIRIVCEGDSWFQYPRFQVAGIQLKKGVKDVIDHLIEDDKYAVKSLDAGADLLRNMYHQREYIETIRKENPHFFLLSAGGNDFFEVFPRMLIENTRPANIMAWLGNNFKTEMAVMEAYYVALLEELLTEFPELVIIIHGYDYVIPHPDGKWIGKPMVDIGINKSVERGKLIRYIMDEFNDVIARVADRAGLKGNVHFLNVRECVPQDPDFWHDEIHPNNRGFNIVAAKFKSKIEELYKNGAGAA